MPKTTPTKNELRHALKLHMEHPANCSICIHYADALYAEHPTHSGMYGDCPKCLEWIFEKPA